MSEQIHREDDKWKEQKVCICALPQAEGKVKNKEEMTFLKAWEIILAVFLCSSEVNVITATDLELELGRIPCKLCFYIKID